MNAPTIDARESLASWANTHYSTGMAADRNALVIGIDEYPFDALRGSENDANDFAAALALEQYGFDVDTLINQQATRRNLIDKLWSLAEASGEILVVYFAGHGLVQGTGGYLVTIDGIYRDPGVSLVELARILADASSRYSHTVLILDCCHAGSGEAWPNARPLTASVVEDEFPVVNASRILLAACQADQKSKEHVDTDGVVHGRFSSALVDGMLGAAVDFDGNVTLLSLSDYVARSVDPNVQTPLFRGDVAGSVLLGSGFEPREGKPLDPSRRVETVTKAQQLVDEYQALQTTELSQFSRRQSSGLKKCSRKLAEVVRWFEETEARLPDVRREQIWRQCRDAITNYRSTVAQIQVGDELPGGKVVRKIGAGGFGVVWEIDGLNARHAYKVLHGSDLSDPVKPQRFRNGYKSMQALEHPRIVRVQELTETPLGFAMQVIDGSDLRTAFVDRQDGDQLLTLAYQIADTVRYAHGVGVVHRDIKPENVILGWDSASNTWVPHLTDFDLAYIETNQTMTVASVGGVIHYAAPEQFYASKSIVARAQTVDVYAFAQLLYYLVCGEDPRAERPENNQANFRRKISELFLEDPAATLIELYQQSSSHDPSGRPQSMEEVCETVLRARMLHLSGRESSALTTGEVCRQVGFAYAGVDHYEAADDGIQMTSRSNTLAISLRWNAEAVDGTASFVFSISARDQMGVPGAASGAQARQKFNQRIDRRLQKYPYASRTAGGRGFFDTRINVKQVELNTRGVAALTEVLGSVISAIEDVA